MESASVRASRIGPVESQSLGVGSGLMVAGGGVRRGYMWAWGSAVAVPVLGLAVALPSHYPYGFDTIGHLGLIYLATAVFVVGALLALKGLTERFG
jgi:hypothetical protein